MFLTGPAIVREVAGEEIGSEQLGGHKVHERNGVCDSGCGRRSRRCRPRQAPAQLPATARRRRACRRPSRPIPSLPTRAPRCRLRRAASTTCARWSTAVVDAGSLLEVGQRWARNILTGLGALRRPAGRRHRKPAALPRRRARCRVGAEGRALRRDLQRVRPAADRARRYARIHAGAAAGVGRGDPLRRDPPARLRRGHGAEADGGAAQGLRRRLHHDELQGPRRRPGLRLAATRRSA